MPELDLAAIEARAERVIESDEARGAVTYQLAAEDVPALVAENARLRAGLVRISHAQFRTHEGVLVWCPARYDEAPCTCGAAEYNARLDALRLPALPTSPLGIDGA